MIEGVHTPYEAADQEAKLITPEPAKKNKKIVIAGLVLAGSILGLVILANVAGMLTSNRGTNDPPVRKPITLTSKESDDFRRQQYQQARYLEGQDRDKKIQTNDDIIRGEATGLAGDPYAESEGVPPKTKAQDEAEHGRGGGGNGDGTKSETQQLRERAAIDAQHRRENDINSSPQSVDFSDYFEKQTAKPAPGATESNRPDPEAAAEEARAREVIQRHRIPTEYPTAAKEEDEGGEPTKTSSLKKEAHDPSEDYAFDSASGKLYRLMEGTIVETVLVNRLAGAAVGPVITMVTTDVYSVAGRLLILKGTRLIGRVSSVSSLNQERLFVAFHRGIMPDGYSFSLDKFQGLDVVGQTGLVDLVNHHYVRIFGASLALAAVGAVTQIGNSGAAYGSYDFGVSMRNGASQQLGQNAQRIMERFVNTLPTFTIRERARVKIMLTGDLLLPDSKNHTMDPDL